ATGDPIDGAFVLALRLSGGLGGLRIGQTDVDGNYSFADIDTGTWRVYSRATGYWRATVDVDVLAGQTSVANLALDAR
ncbi:MAG: carboxypeptidase regulatory-like domain-containing protein, partial [Planctomycetes bacterium]|nr:carboxypeptidase regulatory-like domain-containing protein [Planctomycetota bacterium]